jgi:hypothetical protein
MSTTVGSAICRFCPKSLEIRDEEFFGIPCYGEYDDLCMFIICIVSLRLKGHKAVFLTNGNRITKIFGTVKSYQLKGDEKIIQEWEYKDYYIDLATVLE